MITAIIIASGFGKRMGANKLLLNYKGKTIIEHVLDAVLASGVFKEIILVAGDKDILRLGNERNLKCVINTNAINGQSESVKLGVSKASNEEAYMFFTGDQPFISKEIIEHLVNIYYEKNSYIIVPRHGGRRGNPVIFPDKYKEELLGLKGDEGGRVIIKKHIESVNFVEVEERFLLDVDTPEDYEALCKSDDKMNGDEKYDR